ncbi:MAG: YkvA family protein [Opitutales bacterium]
MAIILREEAMTMETEDHSGQYSDESLRQKLARFARKAGKEVVEKVLVLVEALRDADTPAWAKGTIIAALGYFIAPLDAISDFLPVVGYSDDLGALAMALGAVAAHIKREHIERARARLQKWFPDDEE